VGFAKGMGVGSAKNALFAILVVDGVVPCWGFNFVPSSPLLKDELAELFIASSNWIYD